MAKLGYNTTTGQGAVSNYDIASVIGAGSLDIGTLCTHENVNKWSRIKPLALMADDDTPKELAESDFRDYKEGVYSKPYGLFPTQGTIGEYDFGGIDFTKEEADMKAETEWEYSQPKALDDRVVNGEGIEIYAREPDFCGYAHYADPPIKVEWLEENDGVKGVYAKVTLNVNNDATYGGVKMSDFMDVNTSTGGFFVMMLVYTDDKVPVPESNREEGVNRLAFGYDGMAVTLKDSAPTAVIGMHSGMLAPLSGSTYNFVIVANNVGVPTYSIYTGDGWTTYQKLHYYPKITNFAAIQKSIILEGGVIRKSLNDITGTTLFLTDGFSNTYAEMYSTKNATTTNDDNAYAEISFNDNANGGYGASVKVTEEIPSNKRVLVIKSAYHDTMTNSKSYFNYTLKPSSTGSDGIGLKPLIMDVPMTGTSNKANFYLNFVSRDNVELLWNMTKTDGSVTAMEYLVSPTHIGFGCIYNVIRGIIFSNIVDTKGNVTGMKVNVFYADVYQTPEDYKSESQFDNVIVYPSNGNSAPYLESANATTANGTTEITDYGTFKIGLPSNIPSGYSVHPLGGSVKVDFGIYDSDNVYLGSFFYRQDKFKEML